MRVTEWAIAATLSVHGVLAVSVSQLPAPAPPAPPTVITVREVASRRPPPPPPPPPPAITTPAPAAERPKPAPKPKVAAPAPAPATAAPAASPPPSLGLTLGNTTGGDGPAVAAPRPAPEAPRPVRKTLETKPAEAGGCDEPVVKPRPIAIVQPAFTQEARDAQITGKVRVEITISAAGAVTNARVIAGLGHGLDEAALEAARASTFSPATRCGAAVETTFTIGMRFQ